MLSFTCFNSGKSSRLITAGAINLTRFFSIPHYSSASLTALWKSKTPEHTHRVLKYWFQRVVMYVEIIDRAEIITKNA